MAASKLKKGNLLIAEPSITGDIDFNRAVILLADHGKDGSVGFILNKPLDFSISDLLPEITSEFTVYKGGPVEQDNLYFIHNVPEMISESIEISNGVFWGGDFEATKILINNGQISKDNIRFFLGYTGWEARQLQNEIFITNVISGVQPITKYRKKEFTTNFSAIIVTKLNELIAAN